LADQEVRGAARNARLVGSVREVLAEGPSLRNASRWSGRDSGNRIVVFPPPPGLAPGDRLGVAIAAAHPQILVGEAVRLVLASASPRRAKILAAHAPAFEVVKTDAHEVVYADRPQDTVLENAAAKCAVACEAMRARGRYRPDVLAADTIVWHEGRIFGKPRDADEAAAFLRTLSGRTHTVFTALAFASGAGDVRTQCVRSDVTLRTLSEETIAAYIARVNPLDRAGAYDIDACGDWIVSSYTGEYENIMGLPLAPLRAWGVVR
jgi:septum formation protein